MPNGDDRERSDIEQGMAQQEQMLQDFHQLEHDLKESEAEVRRLQAELLAAQQEPGIMALHEARGRPGALPRLA